MNNSSTITEFLEGTGARLRFFDMGRRVAKIARDKFLQFEKTEIAYPYPLQQQAWFAMLFQDQQRAGEPFIWFLRFPLDEQGKLLQAARDDFMHRLFERIGEHLQATKEGEQIEAALKDNPYSFKPKEERMAVFHAKCAQLLNSPASKFYPHAQEYFGGKPGWEQWSFVGYQGIADLAARLDESDNEVQLIQAMSQLPTPPLVAICHCLENETVSMEITRALLNRTHQCLQASQPDLGELTALLRAVAQSRSQTLQQELVECILESTVGNHIEILAAITGRAWELLQHASIRQHFLERLAQNSAGQDAFNQCMADLLFLPGLREPLLKAVRNPQRSEQLSKAIGVMLQDVSADKE